MAGLRYVLDVSPQMTVCPLAPTWTDPPCQGFGRPRTPTLRRGQRRTFTVRSLALPPDAWQELTAAQGAQGPRTYRFSAERVRATANGQPGAQVWVVHRQNLDGNELRHYLSNAPPATPLATLAAVGGSRWHIETEFETGKSDVGLDEYETRTWPGCHHHVTMCLLASAFLLSLQQALGEKMPHSTRPQVYRVVREILPRAWFGPADLMRWLQEVQARNERGRRSHQKRRAARRARSGLPP